MPHYLPARMLQEKVQIALVGCGGNGSQMLTGLARLNHALVALGHPGLDVYAFDPDVVSEANMGRQMFGAFDVGSPKAHVLVNRINAFFGLAWHSHYGYYEDESAAFDIMIVCVDSARARRGIQQHIRNFRAHYLMDLGNRAADGQVLLGEIRKSHNDSKLAADHAPLASPYEILPELVDTSVPEDDTPSCGLAEALERQELFVNQSIVTPALSILWELFRYGRITWHGAFVNLRSGTMRPLNVKEAKHELPVEQ